MTAPRLLQFLPELAFSHIIEPIEVRFTPEQEALLAQIATNHATPDSQKEAAPATTSPLK